MVLILGGAGFVGSHLSDYLIEKGYDVTIASRTANSKNITHLNDKVRKEKVDIGDTGQLQKLIQRTSPDVIYHLAGQLTTYDSFDHPLYDVDVNAKSTLAILEAMKTIKNSRLILGSTFWVVGKPASLPINEDSICNPLNVYAANRLASEHFCRIYHQVFDLDTVIMRLSNTFGPREQFDNKKKAAINYLIKKGFDEGEIPIYDNGTFFRDIMYISDVVTAAYTIQTKGSSGNTYFLGTNKKTWFYDIGKWISENTGGKVKYIESPPYHKKINVGNILVDNNKLRSLGWNWKVEVKDGIRMTAESYLKEKEGKQLA